MKSFSELAQSVKFDMRGTKIVLNDKDPNLELIGEGKSAAVFHIQSSKKVLKVFYPNFIDIAKEEAEIYKILGDNQYYPKLYGFGDNYLVIDYIKGHTLFHCLKKGIVITQENINDVDKAIIYAKGKGLNPADIHLKNIIITPDRRIKIIDVARYRQEKECLRWKELRGAFFRFYKRKLFPHKVPESILDIIGFLYKKNLLPSFS